MFRTVRSRITVVATTLVLIILVVTGAALVAAQRAVLTETVDEALAAQLAELSGQADGGLPANIPRQGDEEAFALVVDSSGRVVAATTNAPDVSAVGSSRPAAREPAFHTQPVSDRDGPYRIGSVTEGALTIVVGTPLDDVEESVATLTRTLAIAVPAASLVLAALVWLLVGRVLRPVEHIRHEVAEISGGSLDRRVREPGTRDEIDRLAHTMNDMLERLDASAQRQRRFVADASHELRSPLTRIRAALEVHLAHPESGDADSTLRRVLVDAQDLQRLVDDLLALARLDDRGTPRHEPVDLDDIVLREARNADAAIDVSGVSGAQVGGDAHQLGRVVRNLLDNAARHAGSGIAVTLRETDDEIVLTVSDEGPGVPAAHSDRIFERFARVDDARSVADGGVGLGLAIAREIVEAHGGTITLDPTAPSGARFVVRFPRPPT